MTEDIINMVVTAIMGITNKAVHVPDRIVFMRTGLDAIENSGDNLLTPAEILIQRGHLATLVIKQDAMKNGPADKKPQRNSAYGTCYADRFANKGVAQKAADALHDPVLAEALLKRNGFDVKKQAETPAQAPVSIENKEGEAGSLTAKIKKTEKKKKFAIDWEYSYDGGITWNRDSATGICTKTIRNLKSGAAVIVRARVNIGDNPPGDWMVSNTITVAYYQPSTPPTVGN